MIDYPKLLEAIGVPFLKTLVEGGSGMFCILDQNHCYRFVSDHVYRLSGLEAGDLIGKGMWRYLHPEDYRWLAKELNSLQPNKQTQLKPFRYRKKDGTWCWLKATAVNLLEDPAVMGIIANARDITHEVEQKIALEEANSRYEMAMEAADEIIWRWDLKRNLMDRSTAFLRIFGYKPREHATVEFWFSKIVEKDRARVMDSIMGAIGDKEVMKWKEEYGFLDVEGNLRYVSDSAFITRDRSGLAVRMVGAISDITESRHFMDRIQQKNQVLREIAWTQSHQLRAPLVRLQSLLHLLEEEHQPEFSKMVLTQLSNAAQEMDGIIREIVEKSEQMKDF